MYNKIKEREKREKREKIYDLEIDKNLLLYLKFLKF